MAIPDPQACSSPVIDTYRQRTPRSAELFAKARNVLPGGNSRQASYWEPYPLFFDSAEGAHMVDVDGHRYLDLTYNYTALVHGHAYPPILDAITPDRGSGWVGNNRPMVDLAEQLVERIDSVEKVRFTNSGTESGLLALLIARAVTGRHKVLMARYGYHGSLMEFESGTFDRPERDTLLAEYGNLASFETVLEEHGNEIAGVFLEPVMGAGGLAEAQPEFLQGLRRATHRAGALFVLDEVITLRLGRGGRQEAVGITPDLTMFGKLIGGGFPVGAVGGKAELLDLLAPPDMQVFHSGTYNANPVTMAAGAVSVRELTAERIAEMDRLAERLRQGLEAAARSQGLPISVRRTGSLLGIYFMNEPPASSMERTDGELMARFHLACLNHGVQIAPRGMMVMATILDDASIDEILERTGAAMADTAAECG